MSIFKSSRSQIAVYMRIKAIIITLIVTSDAIIQAKAHSITLNKAFLNTASISLKKNATVARLLSVCLMVNVTLIMLLTVLPINTAIADTTNSGTTINSDTTQTLQDSKAQLQDILTSTQYAKPIERQEWQRKPQKTTTKTDNKKYVEDSWWERLLEYLFDSNHDNYNPDNSSLVNVLPALLKMLLIAALIAFIIWVIRQATGMEGWGRKFSAKDRRLSAVSDFEASRLNQGWEHLSAHEQVPVMVNKHIQAQEYHQAASLLYLGGLRWLAKTHALHIAPATTEMQCIEQMTTLKRNSTPLSMTTTEFTTKIIYTWIEVAYNNRPTVSPASSLQYLSDNWLINLPIKNISTKNTAEMSNWSQNAADTQPSHTSINSLSSIHDRTNNRTDKRADKRTDKLDNEEG